jgi:hypothetical protein
MIREDAMLKMFLIAVAIGVTIFLPMVQNEQNTPLNPTIVPSQVPTPIETPKPNKPVEILTNTTTFVDSIDALHIVGEVINNTNKTLTFLKISANLMDANNSLVGTDYTYVDFGNLPPNEKTCFHIIYMDPPSNWVSYQFEDPTYWSDGSALSGMTVLNTSSKINSYGWYDIIGQVRNDSGKNVTYVKPVGTLYDATGNVIGCDYSFVNSTDLTANQTSSFDIEFTGQDYSNVTDYRIQVDGSQP